MGGEALVGAKLHRGGVGATVLSSCIQAKCKGVETIQLQVSTDVRTRIYGMYEESS